MKRIKILSILLLLTISLCKSNNGSGNDLFLYKLKSELNLPGAYFSDPRMTLVRVNVKIHQDGSIEVKDVNAGTEEIREAVKSGIEKIKVQKGQSQERALLIKVEVK